MDKNELEHRRLPERLHGDVEGQIDSVSSGQGPETERAARHAETQATLDAAIKRADELQKQIDDGKVKLEFDDEHGYLESTLKALGVNASSQMLVFSQTSFQRRRISPRTPRAVYFNDDMYVGWVQNGDVLELSAVDPQYGAVFYTLEQVEKEHIQKSLEKTNWRISGNKGAAKILGLKPTTLEVKMKKLGIRKPGS